MAQRELRYRADVEWTGAGATGTVGYTAYSRDHEVRADGVPALLGSADSHFRGSADRWSPELLLLAALSQCHMLWYLHLCADSGVVVTAYRDAPEGVVRLHGGGGGEFSEVRLRPRVRVTDAAMVEPAQALHARAHDLCFIARSVNFAVLHEAEVEAGA